MITIVKKENIKCAMSDETIANIDDEMSKYILRNYYDFDNIGPVYIPHFSKHLDNYPNIESVKLTYKDDWMTSDSQLINIKFEVFIDSEWKVFLDKLNENL